MFDVTSAGFLPAGKLTGIQRSVQKRIVQRIYEIARQEALREANLSPEAYRHDQDLRRPQNVFHIDGSRGSGKTTLLLTIREMLGFLGQPDLWSQTSLQPEALRTIPEALITFKDEIVAELRTESGGKELENYFRTPHIARAGEPPRCTACILPVLFPSDLEQSQSVMEGLFALMTAKINQQDSIDTKRSPQVESHDNGDGPWHKLKDKLHTKISRGWFLSKREGEEAILRDSYNYEHYLQNRGRVVGESYKRVAEWREYVNEYLNQFRAQTLAVFIDDTDVRPEVSEDILHTIRIFLDHPRIVVVIAGNLRSVRQSLLWRAMKDISTPMAALASTEGATALEWRRFIRQQLEEYLEKVLPRQQRFFLRFRDERKPTNSKNASDGTSNQKSQPSSEPGEFEQDDFTKIAGVPLDAFCLERTKELLVPFVAQKLISHQRWRERRVEIANEVERLRLENMLAWWLFRHWYKDTLRPNTLRELGTFLKYSKDLNGTLLDKLPSEHKKRLMVMLFENPENFDLIHRFSDSDDLMLDWLARQKLNSSWKGQRVLEINDRKLHHGSFSHNYLCFALDLGLAAPIHENPRSLVPAGLLTKPAGPNLYGSRPFYTGIRTQALSGIAKALRHSLIPASLLNFYDLQCLPDVVWRTDNDEGPWTSNLIYRWPEVFELQSGRGNTFPLQRAQGMVEDYFIEVVIPLGSLEFSEYVQHPVDLRVPNPDQRSKDVLLLTYELNDKTQPFFSTTRSEIDVLRRRLDYASHLATERVEREGLLKIIKETFQTKLTKFIEHGLPDNSSQNNDFSKALPAYRWLINDARRAWHSTRIFLHELTEVIEREDDQSETPEATERNFMSASDRYRILSIGLLDRGLRESRTLKDFVDRWCGTDEKTPSNAGQSAPCTTWGSLTYSEFVTVIEQASLIQQTAKGQQKRHDTVRHWIVDAKVGQHSEQGLFPTTDEKRWLTDARLARLLLFYIYGVGPCFPALIHLDVAGVIYGNRTGLDGVPPEVEAILTAWEALIRKLQRLVLRYRAMLERELIRLELFCQEAHATVGKNPSQRHRPITYDFDTLAKHLSGKDLERTLVPDWSFRALGLKGREGLFEKWAAEPGAQKALDSIGKVQSDNQRKASMRYFKRGETDIVEAVAPKDERAKLAEIARSEIVADAELWQLLAGFESEFEDERPRAPSIFEDVDHHLALALTFANDVRSALSAVASHEPPSKATRTARRSSN